MISKMSIKDELLKEQQLTFKLPMVLKCESDTVTLRIPVAIVDLMDRLIRDGTYDNRSQIIRIGIRAILNDHGLLKFLPKIEELDKYDLSKLKSVALDFLDVETDD